MHESNANALIAEDRDKAVKEGKQKRREHNYTSLKSKIVFLLTKPITEGQLKGEGYFLAKATAY